VQSIKILFISLILFFLSFNYFAQKVDWYWYRAEYLPALPFGGKSELKDLVKMEIFYPRQALKQKTDGEVFIEYIVNSKGLVVYKSVKGSETPLLAKEAERIFDKIKWQADKNRTKSSISREKMKFIFSAKKYRKLVRKRGYDSLPYQHSEIDSSNRCYGINELDQEVELVGAESVNDFVRKHFNYPSIALRQNISGRVTVKFVIEPYGLISNVQVVEPLAGGCSEETVRLVKAMKWKAGIKNGKAVRTLYTYQLNFVHPGGTVR